MPLSGIWMERLGWTLVHFLWQGTVIALAFAAVRALLGRKLSAPARYALGCLTLAAMTAAPPLTFLLLRDSAGPALAAGEWSLAQSQWQPWLQYAVLVWLAGAVASSIRLYGGWRFTARLRSAARPAPPEWQQVLERTAERVGSARPVRLLVSSIAEVPMAIGWLRPVILVPAGALTGLPLEQMTALLAHELAHIRRHDYLANVLQCMAEALLFYHPAVWWVSQQVRTERELCCDDLAVAASGDVLVYAKALTELESRRVRSFTPAVAADGSPLLERVRRLIEPSRPAIENLPGPAAAWAMSLFWLTGAGIAGLHAAQEPSRLSPVSVEIPAAPLLKSAPMRATLPASLATPSPTPRRPSPALSALLYDPFLPEPQGALQTSTQATPLPVPAGPPQVAEDKKGRIEGRVIGQSGEPLARANIRLSDGAQYTGPALYSAVTDDNGRFVLEGMTPARYRLRVTRTGYLDGPAPESPMLTFSVGAGQSLTGVTVKLTPQGVIAGRVVNRDGDPVEQVSVAAYRLVYVSGKRGFQRAAAATSDDEGRFRIASLAPGKYYLSAAPRSIPAARVATPSVKDVRTVYPNAADMGGASPIDIASGARVEQIEVRLRREPIHTVQGRVTRNGRPIEATVIAVPKDVSSATIGAEGDRWTAAATEKGFELRDLPAGTYVLEASPLLRAGRGSTEAAMAGAAPGPRLTARVEFTLGGSDMTGLVVPVEPALEVTGVFRAEVGELQDLAKSVTPADPPADGFDAGFLFGFTSGKPEQSMRLRPILRLIPADAGKPSMTVMNEDGTFRLIGQGLTPGRHFWEVTNLPDSVYVKSVRYGGVDVTQSAIQVTPGATAEFVLSAKAASVTGVLHNDKNEPRSGVMVTVWPKSPNPANPSSGAKSRVTDANGTFRIGGLPPGDYYVAAWEDEISSALLASPEFVALFTSEAATAKVSEGAAANVDAKPVAKDRIAAATARLQ